MVGNLERPRQDRPGMWYIIFTSQVPGRKKARFEVSSAMRSPVITIHPDPRMAIAKFSEGRMQSERLRQLFLAVLAEQFPKSPPKWLKTGWRNTHTAELQNSLTRW